MIDPSPNLPALAARARALAGTYPPGSPERKAAGCAAVALATCGSLARARESLGGLRDPAVRQAAADLLAELAGEAT